MPSKSKEQHNFMAAVANNASFAKKAGVPKSVGQEFMQADKGIKFKGGQQSRPDLQKANNPKTNHGKLTLFNKGGDTMASKMNPKMMTAKRKPDDASWNCTARNACNAYEKRRHGYEKNGYWWNG